MIEQTKTSDGEKFESFIYTIHGPGSHLKVPKRKKTIGEKSTKETAFEETWLLSNFRALLYNVRSFVA